MVKKATLIVGIALSATTLFGETVYSSLPSTLPPGLPSQPYQAQQTAEFGNEVTLAAGTSRTLDSVSVVLANWAYASSQTNVDYLALANQPAGYAANSSGFYVPLTMNIYDAPASGTGVGALIATQTEDAFVAWRPAPSGGTDGGGCSSTGSGYIAGDGGCYNSQASIVNFDFSGDGVTLPDNLIYGLAFSTESWGASPVGIDGPYDSLNFGLVTTGPSVGSDTNPGTAYWNTETAGDYTDGGTAGVGVFRQDTNWAPYTGAVEINATPEPSTFVMLGGAMVLLMVGRRKAVRRANDAV